MQPTTDTIKNVRFTIPDHFRTRATLSCDFERAHFHVFTAVDSTALQGDVLFKSPLAGTAPGNPHFHNPRRLNVHAAFGKALVQAMRDVCERDGLVAKAQAEALRRQQSEGQELEQRKVLQAQRAAAPRMHTALNSVIDWCYPIPDELPADAQERCKWYAHRLLLIANAARVGLHGADAAQVARAETAESMAEAQA